METEVINIYKLDDPIDSGFAQAVRLGTWSPAKSKPCPECGRSNQRRVPPLMIEWERGPNVIGDFTWPGFNEDIVVRQKIRDFLENNFNGFHFETVNAKPMVRKPKRVNEKTAQPQSSSNEEQLWEMFITSWCHVDHKRTGLRFEKECSICGRKTPMQTDSANSKIIIDPFTWDTADFFRIFEYPRWVYCTERAKIAIQDARFTNITFSLFGYIPKDEPS